MTNTPLPLPPRLAHLPQKQLVGMRRRMSFADNQTFALWNSFMPRRNQIAGAANSLLYSVECYPAGFYDDFDAAAEFEKWAAVEVTTIANLPPDMHALTLPAGLYAVFIHKGPAHDGPKTYRYIFETWLPASHYRLDNRPHFALMGEKYKNNHPDSEEELWIPVREK